jgi:hypothetical protein
LESIKWGLLSCSASHVMSTSPWYTVGAQTKGGSWVWVLVKKIQDARRGCCCSLLFCSLWLWRLILDQHLDFQGSVNEFVVSLQAYRFCKYRGLCLFASHDVARA